MPVTAKPSGCPFFRLRGFPGRSVFQALLHYPRILHQSQITWGRSPSFSEALWLNLWKERFRFLSDFLNILNAKFNWSRLRLSWCAVPKVWLKRKLFHLSNPFHFHIFWAVFYRSSDKIKFILMKRYNNQCSLVSYPRNINSTVQIMLITSRSPYDARVSRTVPREELVLLSHIDNFIPTWQHLSIYHSLV